MTTLDWLEVLLPATTSLPGVTVPTYLLLMAFFLTLCVLLTTSGGQVTILVGGCIGGIFSQVAMIVVAVVLLALLPWTSMHHVLLEQPPGRSLVDPFDSFSTRDFNLSWVLMSLFLNNVYGTMAWQNNHAFNASGLTPHEARMGNFLGNWITYGQLTIITVLGVATVCFLHHPDFAASASGVQAALGNFGDVTGADQARLPLALTHFLPAGLKGLVCAVVLMGVVCGDGIHLHSWSSIFVQDVLMPLRAQPLSLKQHLLWLRLSIVGAALFAFAFGALFRQSEYVLMWLQITMVLFVGGAGSAIIGGLYWSRGTTAGAWSGLLTGSLLSASGIVVRLVEPAFPFNGTEISFAAALCAIAVYLVVSLLTCRAPYDMDRLLHRGRFAVEPESAVPLARRFSLRQIIGIDEGFTRGDRWVAYGVFGWGIAWFLVVLAGTITEFIHPFSEETWALYWQWAVVRIPLAVLGVTCVGYTIGGARDLAAFFRHMHQKRIDLRDDGTVESARNE